MRKQIQKYIRTRLISIILVLAMLLSGTEITAFATETNVSETVLSPEDIEDSNEQTEDPDNADSVENPDEADESVDEQNPDENDKASDAQDPDDEDTKTDGMQDDDTNESDGEEADKSDEKEITEEAEEAFVSIEQKDMSIDASSGMGSLILDEVQIAAGEAASEAQSSYAISEIEVIGTVAQVRFHAKSSSTVVVGIYEENSEKAYAFGYADVVSGENSITVSIEAESLPEYFVVKGYIVDTDSLRPLSEEYFTNMYTKVFQDFLKKTTDDFDQDKVVNLDEDKTTNFAVIKTGNNLIKPIEDTDSGIINELVSHDETTNTYTFANADESIKNLAAEDILIYQRDKSDIVIIKIYSITQRETDDGENVIDIKAYTDELEVDDVFEYVKIEEETGTYEAEEVDASSCPAGVSYLGRNTAVGYAVSGNPSVSMDVWKLDLDDSNFGDGGSLGPISGTVEGNIEAGLSVTVTLEYYFGWGIYDVDINITTNISGSGNIKLEGKLSVPLGSAVEVKNKIITVKYVPAFVIDVYFEGKFSVGTETTFGLKISNQEESRPYVESTVKWLELSAEFGGYIGFDFDPEIDVKNIFHAGLETGVHFGLEVSIEGGLTSSASTREETERHECGNECFSGEIYVKVPFDGELKILKFKEYNLKEKLDLEGDLFSFTIGEFYYSCKYNEFDWGECPHKEYKITVTVKTLSSQVVEGAKVNNEAVTNKKGWTTLWMPTGRWMIYASYNGKTGSKYVDVDGVKEVNITLGIVTYPGNDAVVQVSMIGSSAALKKDGSLYMWGANSSGTVGTGGTLNQSTPFKVNLEEIEFFDNTNVSSAAISKDGSLYTWGTNTSGVLGNGSTDNVYTPDKIMDNIKSVSLSSHGAGAVTKDGQLYMWGFNTNGQVGNGSGTSATELSPVKVLSDEIVEDVCVGELSSAALTKDGKLYMWGQNAFGQLGDGTTKSKSTPVKILEDEKIKKIYLLGGATNQSSAALTEDGTLYMWGYNHDGQLGNGTTDNQALPVKTLENVKEAYISKKHGRGSSAAITKDGYLYMWGDNAFGQLGNGTTEDQTTPAKVEGLSNVKEVSIGSNHSAALTEDGSLYMWGVNNYGQLGDGSTTSKLTPVKVLDNVVKVSLGNFCSAAVTEDGSLWVWGLNSSYQLGDGTYEKALTPQIVQFTGNVQMYEAYSLEEDLYLIESAEDFPSVTPDDSNPARQTVVFSGLRASDVYNIYVMKSKDAVDSLSSDNLLYITQAVSSADGNMSVTYEMHEMFDNPVVFCVGMTQTDLSTADVSVPDITYDGEEHVVEVSVILNGQILISGTDYEVYGDCVVTEIGEYKVVIKGRGLYSGKVEVTFHVIDGINNGDGDDPDNGDVLTEDIPSDGIIPDGLWIAGIVEDGYDYTGNVIKPVVRVYDNKTLLKEKQDYTISYKNNTKANDAATETTAPTITVTGKGNYSGKEKVTFKILPLDISMDTFYADDMALSYTGKTQTPVPKLYWGTKTLKKNTDYTITYYDSTGTNKLTNVKEAGNYYIELAGKGNFTETRRISLTIASDLKQISKVSVSKIANQPYTGSEITPEITVKYGKNALTVGMDYEVNYINNTDIGIAYVVLTGKGEYSGTRRISFKITGPSISKASLTKPEEQIYGGVKLNPTIQLSVKVNGTTHVLSENTDYTVAWSNNQNVGTATAVFIGKGGYSGTLKKTFKIKPFNITTDVDNRLSVDIENETVPYAKGGAKPQLIVTFLNNDGKMQTLTEGTDYTVTYKNNTSLNDGSNTAKAPTATIKGKGNFTGTRTISFKVTTQDISSLTLTAADKNYQNKKNIFSTKIAITDLNGKKLIAGKDYLKAVTYSYAEDTTLDNGTLRLAGTVVDKEDIIPAGTVITVTATAATNGNYTGIVSGIYRITQANISSAKITVPNQIYTGNPVTLDESQITVKIKGTQLKTDQYQIVAGSYQNNIKKGTASVTIKGLDNYGGTKTVKYKIAAKGFLWWWR